MFGRKKEPDPAKVAEREALVASAKAYNAKVKAVEERIRELKLPGGLTGNEARVAEQLHDDETIEHAVGGEWADGPAMLVATPARLLFVRSAFLKSSVEDIPYNRLTSIQVTSGLLNSTITVLAMGSSERFEKAFKLAAGPLVEYARKRQAEIAAGPAAAPAMAPATNDPADQLRKLAALRDDGIITAEDFDAKKRQLLGL